MISLDASADSDALQDTSSTTVPISPLASLILWVTSFTVVSEEVRNLAESSQVTVEKIQKVIGEVVDSVHG